ncbi:MAG TPA: ElyC/SanA/YdcF family protein [Pyrinomonadaceae bacterium]|jgi:SanA protein|nr:ElyC/SanA/YdcF family protein [Pyrinomonadaceae bacterium]
MAGSNDKGRRRKRVIARLLAGAGAACLLLVGGLRWWTHISYGGKVYNTVAAVPEDPEPRVAIVFGAGLWRDGSPSPVLYDRIRTAAELYRAGKVRKLLLTGDNRFHNYNEPDVMRQTAIELGVPADDLVPDYAGRRTYDSCYRAHEIFGVRRAILVTQGFHLDRALYLCDSLGIDSIGVSADRRAYTRDAHFWWRVRELPATFGAWINLNLFRPTPILGERMPIQ